MTEKKWILAKPLSQDVLRQFPETDPVILQLLWNRGVHTQEDMDTFLGPDWSRDIHSPFLFHQMQESVDLVFNALEAGDVITVFGDYDADGVCGTAILMTTLREICDKLGFDRKKINAYIPHREKEGYGVSVAAVEHLHEHDKTNLMITVDCGISNKVAIDKGHELGIETIICDHHTMPAELPSALLIHPLVPGETYPNKFLCGTAVAFKFACGLLEHARKRGADFLVGHEKWLLDLVAIATVTDVMPLTGENRVLEKFGLLVLNKTKRLGLQKLIEVAGGKYGALDTVSIGFQIGPRINAAGRMNHANEALYLLLEEDEKTAVKMARDLHETNIARQRESEKMYEEALLQVQAQTGPLLVVIKDGWSLGLVGLVAGKIVSKFHKPTLVVTINGTIFSGSGRSVNGFDITLALRAAADNLDRFGGHPQACGFSTSGKERFDAAISSMKKYVADTVKEETLCETLDIDAEMALEAIGWDLFDGVSHLAPFGKGNLRPVFQSSDLRVVEVQTVGADKSHLRLTVAGSSGTIKKMIGFRFGSLAQELKENSRVDVAYEVCENIWNGTRELQLKIVDLRIS